VAEAHTAAFFDPYVTDPSTNGEVRVTVLATGFNGYAPELPKVTPAATVLPKPVQAAIPSSETVAPTRERVGARAQLEVDTSQVFDESDLDIPAFIRDHRQKNA
jgi:hypothetical protein